MADSGSRAPSGSRSSPLSSARKVSDAVTLRALAAADASIPVARSAPTTPSAASRRRSLKDRTPRQVQAVLSARKTKMSASAKKLLRGAQGKEQTPAHLLRALSRMGDLPPPTPDEEPEPNASGGYEGRRDSFLPGASSLGNLGEEDDEQDDEDEDGDDDDEDETGDVGTTPRSASAPHSLVDPPSSSEQVAEALLFPSASAPSFFRPGSIQPPPPQPNFNRSQSTSYDRQSLGLDAHVGDESTDLSRRFSTASSRSVEAARRRPSAATSFGIASPGRGMGGYQGEGDDGFEDSMSMDEGKAGEKAVGGQGRYSVISLGASEVGYGRDGRSSIGTVLDDRDGGDTPDRTGRLSMASGFGSASKFAFQNDDGYAEEQLAPLDQQQQDESFSNPDLGEPTAEYDDFGGGGEEEEGGRIPWEDKGKGRASELFREEEGDDEDDDQPVGEQFSDGSEAGAAFDDHGEEQQWSDEQEVQAAARYAMPKTPSLAKAAANRKKRVASKKTQRYTPSGEPVVDLPKARQKSLFQHFLGSAIKLEPDAVDALMDASQEFFAMLMTDASAYAQHAGRKTSINESDIVTLLHRQRVLSDKNSLQSHGRRLGLDRELQTVLDGLGRDGRARKKGVKGKKRGRSASGDGDEEGRKKRKSVVAAGERGKAGGKGRKKVEEDSESASGSGSDGGDESD